MYLNGSKTHAFTDKLEILGFEGTGDGLRPSQKHRERVEKWPVPTNRAELDAFLWLTPFLRIFIPGRAAHVLTLKRVYLELVPAELAPKKRHDDDMEECDRDFTRKPRARVQKESIRQVYREKELFTWGPEQKKSFEIMKNAICENAMAAADLTSQYHLAVDASQNAVGRVLFQLHDVPPGTKATSKVLPSERIVMFILFRLGDAETRYGNSERECLAVLKCLAETKWLTQESPYPIFVYTDHKALEDIHRKGDTNVARIDKWIEELAQYDTQTFHRPSTDQHIRIADGLSRMPTQLIEEVDAPRQREGGGLAMATLPSKTRPLKILKEGDRHQAYRESPMYRLVFKFLEEGLKGIEDEPRNFRRQTVRKARRYLLATKPGLPVLRYCKTNGTPSLCILEIEVPRFLARAHEEHGHYAAALSLSWLIGKTYWPTRVTDVHTWCQSCHSCQMRAKKPIKSTLQAILHFEPMGMIGLDRIGPISLPCTLTGFRYILLAVDYFSRFTWGRPYAKHKKWETVDMLANHIAPIFGNPKTLYTDNGTHFVNQLMEEYTGKNGIIHYTGPVSHPSSTGLLERSV